MSKNLPSSFVIYYNNYYIGLTTNGEWNSLRLQGDTRPLSIIQIRSDVRAKYSRLGYKTMINMLTPKGKVYMKPCIFMVHY